MLWTVFYNKLFSLLIIDTLTHNQKQSTPDRILKSATILLQKGLCNTLFASDQLEFTIFPLFFTLFFQWTQKLKQNLIVLI